MIAYIVIVGFRGVAWTGALRGLFMLDAIQSTVGRVVAAAGGPTALSSTPAISKPEFLMSGDDLYSPQYIVASAVTIAFSMATFLQISQRFFVARSGVAPECLFVL